MSTTTKITTNSNPETSWPKIRTFLASLGFKPNPNPSKYGNHWNWYQKEFTENTVRVIIEEGSLEIYLFDRNMTLDWKAECQVCETTPISRIKALISAAL